VYFFYKGEADGKDIIALVVCLVIGFIFNRIGSIIYKICLAIVVIAFIIAIVVKLYNYKPHNKAKSAFHLQINTNQNTPLVKEDIRIIQAKEITEEINNTEDTVNTIAESENIDFEKN
jgi:c-di-AMP phosphodiesterase-like protein